MKNNGLLCSFASKVNVQYLEDDDDFFLLDKTRILIEKIIFAVYK